MQNLTDGQFHGPDRHLWVHDWLNDGRLLYSILDRTTATLYGHRIGETGATQVMEMTLRSGLVALTTDGLRAAYTNSTEKGVTIWSTTLVNGMFSADALILATFYGASVSQLQWTEDGEWLVFQVTGGMVDMVVQTIYAIRADGTDLHQLGQAPSLSNLSVADNGHVIVEDHDIERLLVLAIEEGQRKTLEVPGLRPDQQIRGGSWR